MVNWKERATQLESSNAYLQQKLDRAFALSEADALRVNSSFSSQQQQQKSGAGAAEDGMDVWAQPPSFAPLSEEELSFVKDGNGGSSAGASASTASASASDQHSAAAHHSIDHSSSSNSHSLLASVATMNGRMPSPTSFTSSPSFHTHTMPGSPLPSASAITHASPALSSSSLNSSFLITPARSTANGAINSSGAINSTSGSAINSNSSSSEQLSTDAPTPRERIMARSYYTRFTQMEKKQEYLKKENSDLLSELSALREQNQSEVKELKAKLKAKEKQ